MTCDEFLEALGEKRNTEMVVGWDDTDRLIAELRRARDALKQIAACCPIIGCPGNCNHNIVWHARRGLGDK